MRVTDRGSASLALAAMTSTAERVADVQRRMASERRITKPSDDPGGTAVALGLRSETARDDAYTRATSSARSRLDTLDTTMGSVTTALQRAQDLIRQGMSTGTLDDSAREALASQLDDLSDTVLALANTTDGAGRPVFGGSAASGGAFTADGSYVGSRDVPTRVVAPGTTVPVGTSGDTVFGEGADSVFATLHAAAAAVRAGDVDGARATLGGVDTALTRVDRARSVVGGTGARLEALADAAAGRRVERAADLSALQDLDLPAIAIELSSAQLAYNASLQVAASSRQSSLLDFLR